MNFPLIYHPDYSIPWPAVHRFPMSKFQRLRLYLEREGLATETDFKEPQTVSRVTLTGVHHPDYVDAFFTGQLPPATIRRIGLGWAPELVTRTRAEVGGTVMAVKQALTHGLAINTAGGTHHAFPDYGSGFCVLNDLAVAAKVAIDQHGLSRVLIFDLDVHQGDGCAYIFKNEPRVFTCSIHCEKNFPFRKQQSDLDVGLPPHTADDDYLRKLYEVLPFLLDSFKPALVLYDAGVDCHSQDKLGHLDLSYDGLLARDQFVLKTCLAKGVPIAAVVGGGYTKDLDELVYRHALLVRAARAVAK